MLFYIPDLEEYKNYRGLYMEPDKLPGPALTSVKEIGNSINNLGEVINKYKDSYSQAKNFACPYDDGNVSSRIVDIVLEEILLIQMVIHTALLNVKIQRRNYYSLAADFA